MASINYFTLGGVEIVNAARTVDLARVLGVDSVSSNSPAYDWIRDIFGGPLTDMADAPWYNASDPASGEFAGFMPLSVGGLNDSSYEGQVTEYLTTGGHTGRGRSATRPLVFGGTLVASTTRGMEYGTRWFKQVLRGSATCGGRDLNYFRTEGAVTSIGYRRNVALTRSLSVTGERRGRCSILRMATFTLTAGDPFAYGASLHLGDLTKAGAVGGGGFGMDPFGTDPFGGVFVGAGTLVLENALCPSLDFSPVSDPLFPALIQPPALPNFLPSGWNIEPGMKFLRIWAKVGPVGESLLDRVPVIDLGVGASAPIRRARVAFWPADAAPDGQCHPLFSAVVSYAPTGGTVSIDGIRSIASFSGSDGVTRRADGVVFSPTAGPVDWTAFSDPDGFVITLDLFETAPGVYEGGADSVARFNLVERSD